MNGIGLLLFFVAKVLIIIIYPFGFTYSLLFTFFKSFVVSFKHYSSNWINEYLYYPKVCGVGCIGEYKIKTEIDKSIYKVWSHMIDRCYNVNCKEYKE
jgi:hypothetical protein